MEYCKNKKLEGVGEHIFGVYPDKCYLCKSIKEVFVEKKERKTYKYEKFEEQFRNETILANNWKQR